MIKRVTGKGGKLGRFDVWPFGGHIRARVSRCVCVRACVCVVYTRYGVHSIGCDITVIHWSKPWDKLKEEEGGAIPSKVLTRQ